MGPRGLSRALGGHRSCPRGAIGIVRRTKRPEGPCRDQLGRGSRLCAGGLSYSNMPPFPGAQPLHTRCPLDGPFASLWAQPPDPRDSYRASSGQSAFPAEALGTPLNAAPSCTSWLGGFQTPQPLERGVHGPPSASVSIASCLPMRPGTPGWVNPSTC